ncbi:hypothetical protein NE237_007171 [Protea cynaroides]|uniref:Uncharacterized protein n=1 Tax=Protea cynaroides TaxID=273540 RepID=A0A9Q0KNW9_9MAGN|nr:hypothetical protein NE237_007171 [Protea cynaroides]
MSNTWGPCSRLYDAVAVHARGMTLSALWALREPAAAAGWPCEVVAGWQAMLPCCWSGLVGLSHANQGWCQGSAGGGSGEDPDVSDPHRRRKRYHRHTARQIQELEAVFKECPHPDEKQRSQLSRDLGLEPRQIKFWFQNRRTQMKSQHERADNCSLRAENDKIRCENIAIREALRNVICPNCGGPPMEDSYFDEQKLRVENARLKEELDRVSSIAAKYMGRPIAQLPSIQPFLGSSLDLSVGSFGGQPPMGGPSLDLDLLPGSSSSVPVLPSQTSIPEMEKSMMAGVAANALEELIRLIHTNEPLWMKSPVDGREVLNLENYQRIFPKPNRLNNPDICVEASRDSGVVMMNGLALVEMFMDSDKWVELFPTVVSSAKIIDVLPPGIVGNRTISLQLMFAELQVLSPLVPTREVYFLRYCQQIEEGLWAIGDVSFDLSEEIQSALPAYVRKLPSGCLIQDLPNGYSKVTWVEHVELEDKSPTHRIYRDFIHSGMAFGAERWICTLQRMCERLACLMVTNSSSRDLGGVIPSPEGRRSLMRLAQRMVSNFCASVTSSTSHRWTTLSGLNDVGVRVTVHKSSDPGEPNGVVLSAATTIWLPVPPQVVFNFFRDERTRSQWDVLSNGNSVHEVAHITNGSHPGNSISVLRAFNSSQNNMLILQESCTDPSGSLVVYSPVDLPAINVAMSGEDTMYIPLLPSGFTITPDGRPDQGGGAGPSTSSNMQGSRSGGSLITVAFQILRKNPREVFHTLQGSASRQCAIMDDDGGLNIRNWDFYGLKGHLGLQLVSSVAERDTKSLLSGRESAVMVSANGTFHHRDCGVPEAPVPMDFVRDGWMNQRDKFLHVLPGNPNFAVLSEASGVHPLQMLQQPDASKDDRLVRMEEAGVKKEGPLKKRQGGRASNTPKSPKPKKSKRAPGVPKDESIPIPICSCTGAPQQCYRWGCGGWQSACCTTNMSMYPLPMSTKRRGARIAGRKMSQGAFKKVLEKLAAEGYNLSSPIDLRTHWAKHGTNKFVTIS